MSYFKKLGLTQEAFSTSPDPNFFYEIREHKAVYYKLRVTIQLKRGLSLILGDVGVGKTTLLRKLYNDLANNRDYVIKVILDPTAESESVFLSMLTDGFQLSGNFSSVRHQKDALENYLVDRAGRDGKTVVLFVDEAQKLSADSMEVLRLLLNFENSHEKLIQIVLFGQIELLPRIMEIHNLWDRIALRRFINPLTEEDEVKALIEFRLRKAGYLLPGTMFDDGAIALICDQSRGYPRKMSMLCHEALEYIVMHDLTVIDRQVIRNVIDNELNQILTASASATASANVSASVGAR